MNKISLREQIIIFLLGFITTFFIFFNVFLNPNEYLFGPGGDGILLYYYPSYFIKYAHGIHFSGMNYPYGTHISFADSQPIISFFMRFIENTFFPVSQYTVGVFNILMLFSIPICILLVYIILRRLSLPLLYCILVSFIIGFLSPQINRFTGHYGLSYSFFVPAIWLFIDRYNLKKNLQNGLLFVLLAIFFAFIHLYYLPIACMFFALSSIYSSAISNISSKLKYLECFKNLIYAIIPLVTVKFIFFLLILLMIIMKTHGAIISLM